MSTIDKELRMGAATGFMKLRTLAATLLFYALTGLFSHTEASAQGTAAIHSGMPVLNSSPPSSSSSSQTTGEQKVLHKKCADAGERLEHDVAAMVPGRRWTWQLDSERSRERLEELQHDLTAFREADVAFEESLSPGQRSKFNPHMTATRELFQHLERDTRSLDDELRKGHPTRWHVANDVSDMRKEINRWRKLHQRLAEDLAARGENTVGRVPSAAGADARRRDAGDVVASSMSADTADAPAPPEPEGRMGVAGSGSAQRPARSLRCSSSTMSPHRLLLAL